MTNQNIGSEANREGQAPRNYHPENIAGKAVVLSGGTTGIGRAIAQLLVERGARVLIFGRDPSDLQKALSELQAAGEVHGLNADQSRPEDVRRVFAEADSRLGGVDILVNNAAVSAEAVAEIDIEQISYALNTNLLGYMACAHEAIGRMKPKGGGHIINIGSMSADQREEEHGVYVATKAGIQAFSESLRKTVNPQGIKVSLIEPGLVESDLTVGTGDDASHSPEEARRMQEEGTMLTPMDIAEAVHYCLTQPVRCDVVTVQIRPHKQSV